MGIINTKERVRCNLSFPSVLPHLLVEFHFALVFVLLIGVAMAAYAIPKDFDSHDERRRTGLYSGFGGACSIFAALCCGTDAMVKWSMWLAAFTAVKTLILTIVLYEMCHMQQAGYRFTSSGEFVKNYRWRGAPQRYPTEEDL